MYVNTTGCLISPVVLTAIFVIRRKLINRIAQSVSRAGVNDDTSAFGCLFTSKTTVQKTTDKRQHELIARVLFNFF